MNHEEVVSRIADEIKNEGVEFNLDDPFDDPSLVTTAFMDIDWQDDHGNSALMLAAAENRVLQVKGILTMAINGGKLWQIIDMRNKDGQNCVDMAVRSGSETCAMLITKVAREYGKIRPRPVTGAKSDEMVTENDVNFEMMPKGEEPLDENYVKELVRQSSSAFGHGLVGKRLSREKLSNIVVKSGAGHEYLKMVKRSRSAHSRLMSQRTFSVESDPSSEPTTPQLPLQPPDHGVFSSVGERIRSIFGKKPPMHAKSVPVSIERPLSVANKPYQSSGNAEDDSDHVKLPQHTADFSSPEASGSSRAVQRSAFWATKELTYGAASSTQNGVRLPPLSLRRRASSDPRNRNFSSLGDDQ